MRVTRIDEEQRRIRMENERWRALYELTSTLTGTLSYKRVLDSVLDLGYIALNPDPDAEADEKLISAVMLFRVTSLSRSRATFDQRRSAHKAGRQRRRIEACGR